MGYLKRKKQTRLVQSLRLLWERTGADRLAQPLRSRLLRQLPRPPQLSWAPQTSADGGALLPPTAQGSLSRGRAFGRHKSRPAEAGEAAAGAAFRGRLGCGVKRLFVLPCPGIRCFARHRFQGRPRGEPALPGAAPGFAAPGRLRAGSGLPLLPTPLSGQEPAARLPGDAPAGAGDPALPFTPPYPPPFFF